MLLPEPYQVSPLTQARISDLTCPARSDILSFYKETLDGESDSYIHARARLTGKAVADTLYEVMGEVIATTERIRAHFGEGRMRDAWDRYEAGYIWFHTGNPRYRLHELVDTEYMPEY